MQDKKNRSRGNKRQFEDRNTSQAMKLLLFAIAVSVIIFLSLTYMIWAEMKKSDILLRQIETLRNEEAKADDVTLDDSADALMDGSVDAPTVGPAADLKPGQSPDPSAKTEKETDYVSRIETIDVEAPVRRTREEALEKLAFLGESNPVIAKICQNSFLYPEELLMALANNPEMADFAADYIDGAQTHSGGLTPAEKAQDYPLLLQWDPRWGYEPYGGDSCIGLSGCGPTCLSMVLYYLTGNEQLTPDRLAAYSMENGYYVYGTGTAWALMEDLPALYGLSVSKPGLSESEMKAQLDRGKIMICAMRKGDFTVEGHFIVIYGYGEDGFLVNDPNCAARSRRRWTFEELKPQIKSIWAYGLPSPSPNLHLFHLQS